jgi:hypothetical protein
MTALSRQAVIGFIYDTGPLYWALIPRGASSEAPVAANLAAGSYLS